MALRMALHAACGYIYLISEGRVTWLHLGHFSALALRGPMHLRDQDVTIFIRDCHTAISRAHSVCCVSGNIFN